MKRLGKVVGLALLAFLALLVLGGGFLAWSWRELKANGARVGDAYAAGLAQVRPAFLEDQDLARAHPILAPAAREKDAGPELNPRIGWDGDPQRVARWLDGLPKRPPPIALDDTLTARIPKDFLATPPEVWKGLDFSWLAALAPYDHWDVESNSPWADSPAGECPNGFPKTFELTPWAKLRLAKGISEGHPAEAVAEVEHLAQLLLSTETLIGAAGGLAALQLVDEALSSLERRGRPAPRSASRLDRGAHARAWRATMAARSFLLAQAPMQFHPDVERILVGRCAALNEALRSSVAFWAAFGRGRGDQVHWLQLDGPVASTCRLTWVRRALAGQSVGAAARNSRCNESQSLVRLACRAFWSIPLLDAMDRAIGREVLIQMAVANASPVSLYETPATAEQH